MATYASRSATPGGTVESTLYHVFLFFAVFALIDPFYTGIAGVRVTRDLGPLKYVPLFFALLAAAVAAVALVYRRQHWRAHEVSLQLVRVWPLLLLMLLVLGGSLWARWLHQARETYLQVGAGMLFFPLAVLLLHGIGQEYLAARRFLLLLLWLTPVVLVWTAAARIAGGQAYHIEVFLFSPLAVYAFLAVRSLGLRVLVVGLCLAVGIAGHKNTGYLTTLLTLAYLVCLCWPRWVRRDDRLLSIILKYLTGVLLLAATAVVGFLLVERDSYLPTGSVEVRSQTYLAAYNRFLDSPLWGNLFTASTLTELSGIVIFNTNLLVSHSDALDMLANGGLLGVLLTVFGVFVVFARVRRALGAACSPVERALLHGLSAIVLGGLITASFNSPGLALPVGSLFWLSLGMLYAVACAVDACCVAHRRKPGSRVPRRQSTVAWR